MDRFAWDDTLATGHTRMDTEHKELADLFNRLRDAVAGGKDLPACAGILDDVIAHARVHFELEQQWMVQYRYPKTEQHEAEHAMLLRQALDYRKRFDLDADTSRSTLMQFAEVWLAFHILFSDKELAAFLVRAGAISDSH